MKSICRACAKSGEFSNLLSNENTMTAFFNLSGIAVDNDGLPKSLCNKCFKLLNKFTQFRNEIIKNNSILLNSLECSKATAKLLDKQTEENVMPIEAITIKEECPINEIEDTFTNENDSDDEIVKIKYKKERNKAKRESKSVPKGKTPRNLIKVDPTKITTVTLTKTEQQKRHTAMGESLEYKNMPFKCDKCYKGFNYDRKLRSHIEKYHKVNWEFECDICSRTMINAASLNLHTKKHAIEYQCNICRTSFAEKLRAISHYQNIHEGISREYPCQHCGKVFYNRSTLNGHIRNHHPTSERPQCTKCNKTFVSSDSLQDHMLIHTGEKNYSCDICGAKFRLRQCARIHMLSHSVVKNYCCTCGATFKSKSSYSQHLLTAGPHVTEEVKAKNTCATCGRQFSTRYGLKKHLITHSLNRSEIAERSKRSVIAKLSQRQTPRIRCICHYCGRGFSARRPLERHIARAHLRNTNAYKELL